uniref:F-box domain-containing protein n=1 Tax=Aegilops tauschii subsp. strangulata TaxID=200361 RepID=A0A453QXW1_AEGTS
PAQGRGKLGKLTAELCFFMGSSITRCLALSGVLTTYGQRLAEFLAVHRLLPSEPQILERPTPPELPEDILMCIFASLETPDLVRAGSVCSSWRSACARLCNLGLFRQTQTPCLLYTSESAGESVAGLFSLVENKSYTLALPDPPIRTRYVIGSSHGWIITADDRSELHLLNPITGDQIALPSVATIEQVKPIFDDAGALHKYQYSWYTGTPLLVDYDFPTPSVFSLGELRDYLFGKAFLSSDPSTGDYYVVLKHNPESQLSFARAGDDRWTWLPPHVDYADCVFKDSLLFALDSHGEVRTFDLSALVVTQTIVLGRMKSCIVECNYMYIAQAPCGDLLEVWRSRNSLGWEDEDVSEQGLEDGEDEHISEHNLTYLKWILLQQSLKTLLAHVTV